MAAAAVTRMAPVTPAARLATRLLGFVRFLHEQGFRVGVAEVLDTARLAAALGLLDARRLRSGLRALCCGDPHDWARFDALFDAYWHRRKPRRAMPPSTGAAAEAPLARADAPGGGRPQEVEGSGEQGLDAAGDGASRGGASAREALARCDFRRFIEPDAMAAIELLVERLAQRLRRHLVRRRRLDRRSGHIDLRRTLRHSLRYGGTPLELAFRRRRRELPRLVLLLDVSRSMSLYSYLLLRFARGLLGAFRDAEAFVFHTRLVPVSEALREPDGRRLRERLALLSLGWSGGTRIGESLERFHRDHAGRLLRGHAIVVVMSDGLDTGPPEQLAGALGAIRARARRIVWLNPLLGRDGYRPLAGGMRAALPLIDRFLPAHNLASLRALERELCGL